MALGCVLKDTKMSESASSTSVLQSLISVDLGFVLFVVKGAVSVLDLALINQSTDKYLLITVCFTTCLHEQPFRGVEAEAVLSLYSFIYQYSQKTSNAKLSIIK